MYVDIIILQCTCVQTQNGKEKWRSRRVGDSWEETLGRRMERRGKEEKEEKEKEEKLVKEGKMEDDQNKKE